MAESNDLESPEDAERSEPATRGRGSALAVFSLLMAMAATAASGWVSWQWYNFQPAPPPVLPELPDVSAELADFRQQLDGDLSAIRRELDEQLQRSRSDTDQRLQGEGDRAARHADELASAARRDRDGLQRRLATVEDGLARLSERGLGSERALGVAEAEFLLRMANERLLLFGDPAAALTALKLADDQLKSIDDPLYAGVRQALAAEIQALASVDAPDRVAISGRLLQLASTSPEWPLDARRSLQAEGANLLQPESDEQGWWSRLKTVAASVVVVHREVSEETVLLTLEEERLLKENVQLQLQVAQLAAVRGEQSLYAAAIGLVRDWLLAYYDQQSVQVTEAQAALAELESTRLQVQLPEIDGSLRRLRNLRATEALAEGSP